MSTSFLIKSISKAAIISAAVLSVSACIIHVGNDSDDTHGNGVSSIFGGLDVSQGKHVSNVSSVNGSINLADSVNARNVDTVNGDIDMGQYVTVKSAKTVNGDIEAQQDFHSQGPVETVNGSIRLTSHSRVDGDVENVNGVIELSGVIVSGNTTTYNGDIILKDGSQIQGDIIFYTRNQRKAPRTLPVLKIENGVIIDGQIILRQEVELQIDDAQLLKKVSIEYGE
ncbi:hypothetical protein [Aliiglaciecola sp. LCG003]|uniref:hypothetical protein n=1 Tax=Aliiglaciecola sp. LCG003 TaxID=3053655 RepID=UPI002573CEE4|nr:hypothetical protein [Aliiglaciecola sp. LCG003]WJG10856.1 hypothetical protein QR722_07450 [Aliiglaciecola sp. LCG003]